MKHQLRKLAYFHKNMLTCPIEQWDLYHNPYIAITKRIGYMQADSENRKVTK